MAEESDYAQHLQSTGVGQPWEGTRTWQPNEEQEGDGSDADSADEFDTEGGVFANDNPNDTQGGKSSGGTQQSAVMSTNTEAKAADGVVPIMPPEMESENLVPQEALNHDGIVHLCTICHQPRRGHVCTGSYTPVRQSTVSRRRMGLADVGDGPKFGIYDAQSRRFEAVFASNDRRQVQGVLPTSWEAEARRRGQDGLHVWAEKCADCGRDGNVQLCYSCNLVYHARCLVRKTIRRGLHDNEEMICPQCVQELMDAAADTQHE
jgi:hypothetical protein